MEGCGVVSLNNGLFSLCKARVFSELSVSEGAVVRDFG